MTPNGEGGGKVVVVVVGGGGCLGIASVFVQDSEGVQ